MKTTDREVHDEHSGSEPYESQIAYCSMPVVLPPRFPEITDSARLEAILTTAEKWVNGTVLRYYFFDRDTDGAYVTFDDGTREWRPWTTDAAHKDLVRSAFEHWKEQGIGLDFLEVQDRGEAEVRIGFMRGDGHWSGLGRDILNRGVNDRTMNLGQSLLGTSRGFDTAMHEIGHTLGLPHEHQNPFAGIGTISAHSARRTLSWCYSKTSTEHYGT